MCFSVCILTIKLLILISYLYIGVEETLVFEAWAYAVLLQPFSLYVFMVVYAHYNSAYWLSLHSNFCFRFTCYA